MKTNEKLLSLRGFGLNQSARKTKYQHGKMNKNHYISLIFTLWASRRLPSAALLRTRHPAYSGIASPLNALHMKASDSCKIQIIYSIKNCWYPSQVFLRILIRLGLLNLCWGLQVFGRELRFHRFYRGVRVFCLCFG